MPWELILAALGLLGLGFGWLKGRSSGKADAAKERRDEVIEDAGPKAKEAREAADQIRRQRERDRRNREREIEETEDDVDELSDEELADSVGGGGSSGGSS